MKRRWAQAYAAAGAVTSLAYFAVPAFRGQLVVYCAVGLSTCVAIVVGICRYRPRAALAWWLFAAAELVTVVGDVFDFTLEGAFPSAADVFYLASYPLLAAGLVLLVHSRSPGRDLAALLDAAIVTLGVGVLAWVFLMEPYVSERGVGILARSVSIGYPLMDLLLLGVAVRLAMGDGTRPAAFFLLVASMVALLVTDSAYGAVQLTHGYGSAIYLDSGWLASYLLLGAAALHPSMRTLSRRAPRSDPGLTNWRLALLGVVLLLAPAVEAAREVSRGDGVRVVYVASTVVGLLVLIRMAGLVRRLRFVVAEYGRAERSKEDFVSTVSHELRTPLTSIVGYIELMRDGEAGGLGADQIRMLATIDRNSQRLLNLIDDLLVLSQIRGDALTSGAAPTDLDRLLEGVQAAVSPTAAAHDVTFVCDVAPRLGTLAIDAALLDRALLNLLSNAVKFTPEGGRVTFLARRSEDEVILTVADTGIGIPAREQPLLFTRFFRSSVANQLAIPGTGLGLSIVKGIVEGNNGTIEVKSALRAGTTVTVRFPSAAST